jgi:hypothetical protein
MLAPVIFLFTGIVYAGNGDLIVNGNLGVGTSTPGAKAEVNGSLKVDGTVTNNGETVNGSSTVTNNLTVNGNVGIGTTSPQAKLHVNGDFSFEVSGTRVVAVYLDQNLGEDTYAGWRCSNATDTCTGDPNSGYTCAGNDQKLCTDTAFNYNSLITTACPATYVNRVVSCKRPVVFVMP